jgi:hypothetical protein
MPTLRSTKRLDWRLRCSLRHRAGSGSWSLPPTGQRLGEGAPAEALAPLERDGGEHPYDNQRDLQTDM